MDPPQTKKQKQKGAQEKRTGHGRLHSGPGTRATEANQGRSGPSSKKKKGK